jgi:hypothetical protein
MLLSESKCEHALSARWSENVRKQYRLESMVVSYYAQILLSEKFQAAMIFCPEVWLF